MSPSSLGCFLCLLKKLVMLRKLLVSFAEVEGSEVADRSPPFESWGEGLLLLSWVMRRDSLAWLAEMISLMFNPLLRRFDASAGIPEPCLAATVLNESPLFRDRWPNFVDWGEPVADGAKRFSVGLGLLGLSVVAVPVDGLTAPSPSLSIDGSKNVRSDKNVLLSVDNWGMVIALPVWDRFLAVKLGPVDLTLEGFGESFGSVPEPGCVVESLRP